MAIPKLAHWIWLSPELPCWAEENIAQFRQLHGNWSFRIWHELPADFPESLRAIINTIPWYSSRSDIFRYWLLAEYGGVFLDTDIVPLRPFDDLLKHSFFLAPCQPEGHDRPHLNCALMGCEAKSAAMISVLDECHRYATQALPPKRIAYGPDLLTRLFASTSSSEASILPSHYFYLIPDRTTAHQFWRASPQEREEILSSFRTSFTDNCEPYAVHLWGVEGSSQRQVPASSVSTAE